MLVQDDESKELIAGTDSALRRPPRVSSDNSALKTRVLVVEDNMYSAYAITSILQQYSLEVDLAINGEQAVKMVKERYTNYKMTYELVIMDYYLPLIDGITAIQKIRKYLTKKDSISPVQQTFICMLTSNQSSKCK